MPDDATEVVKSVEERDREWLETVFRGDSEPQLTVRAIIAGMLFGGLMSLSNLYVGLKSGWGLGVDIAAVIVIFAVFKALRGVGLVKKEFGMMENTIMMTVAVAASWISSAGLVSAVPALTMLTGYTFVWWQLTMLIGIILYLGLFMAIPFKRQMIQVDNLRFPANIPTGETLKAVYAKAEAGEEHKGEKPQGKSVWVSPIGAVITLIGFFLPWVRFSYDGKEILQSGAQLGGGHWLIFVAALIVFGAVVIFRRLNRVDSARPLAMALSLIGMGWAFFAYFSARNGLATSVGIIRPEEAGLTLLFGAVISFLGLVVALLGSLFVRSLELGGNVASRKARSLGLAGGAGVVVGSLRDGLAWIPSLFPLPTSILGTSFTKLTLSLEPSLIFVSIGALFGIKVGLSMLFGLVLNYGVLAPNLVHAKIIKHLAPQVRAVELVKTPLAVQAGQSFAVEIEEANRGPEMSDGSSRQLLRYVWTQPVVYGSTEPLIRDLNAPTLLDGSPNPFHDVLSIRDTLSKSLGATVLFAEAPKAIYWESKLTIIEDQPPEMVSALGFKPGASRLQTVGGFRNISAWSLWPGATVLVVGGLLALAFQWKTLGRTFASVFTSFGKKKSNKGVLDHLEVPMTWFVPGFLITGLLATALLIWLFKIHWYMGLIAVLMSFFLAAVAARAGAEIGINPIGALGKVTQLTYGVIAPGNVTTNLMTAGITAGAACSCSDTVGNLKVGHMVGAHPRKQFIAQLFGVLAGAFLAVPAYFILVPDANMLGGDKFPAPSALVWMGVAKVLSQGLSTLPPSAVLAMIIAFIFGVIIVVVDKLFPKLKPYTPSPAALGIAFTIPAYTSFAMFLGAVIVWVLEKKASKWNDMYTIPIASGCIAGESITGVFLAGLMAAGVLQ
jgi:uncharacterized oligopeptide transporter (OPT) family protein